MLAHLDASAREVALAASPQAELVGAEVRAIAEWRRMNAALARAVNAEALQAHRAWHAVNPGRALPEARIRGAMIRGRARFRRNFPDKRITGILSKIATSTTTASKRLVRGALPEVLGDRVGALALTGPEAASVRAGRRLVKSVATDYSTQVRKLLREGKDPAALRKALGKRASVAKSRADLIAINETHNLNSAATRALSRRAGLPAYTWNTQLDDDVRDEHAEREGLVFLWSDAPPDGHPGQPPRCRCWATPVLDEP